MASKFYKTEGAKIGQPQPRQLRGKTAQEIVAYMREHFSEKLGTDEIGHTEWVPLNKATAYLMAISVALFDPADWRNPIYAIEPDCGKEWAKAAVIWYHGAEPRESLVGVYSTGYACW